MYNTREILDKLLFAEFTTGNITAQPSKGNSDHLLYTDNGLCIARVEREDVETDAECEANAKLFTTANKLLESTIQCYLFMQEKARNDVDFAIETDAHRAVLIGRIAQAIGKENEFVQNTLEQIVLKGLCKEV